MSDGDDDELERATSDVATAQPFVNPLHRLIERDCGSIVSMGVRRPPTEAQLALERLIERREVDSLLGIFLSGSETTSVGKLYAFLGLRALSSGAQNEGGDTRSAGVVATTALWLVCALPRNVPGRNARAVGGC